MLDILAQHGLIIKEPDQLKPIFNELILFSLFEERFGPSIINLKFRDLLGT